MRCKWVWLHFPISPQQQVSLPVKKKRWEMLIFSFTKLPGIPVRFFCCRIYKEMSNYAPPLWMCLLLWFMFNPLLTVHLDLKRDGCIGQITLGIEGVLALFPSIHSLKLKTSMVPKKKKKTTTKSSFKVRKEECLQNQKWLILWFEFRLFLWIMPSTSTN